MIRRRLIVFARMFVWAVGCLLVQAAPAQRFSFVALGDMPYGPDDQVPYQRLIETINRLDPVFSVHVGDIKSGSTRCDDEVLLSQRDHFNRFVQPLIYTPGDNEWTDCHRTNNGAYDPLERLAFLRQTMFASRYSLGQKPLLLTTQPELDARYDQWVENRRWMVNEVVFATVHIVGSNNNLDPKRPQAQREHLARDAANQAWLQATLAWARATQAKAVVLALHADPFEMRVAGEDFPAHSGFAASFKHTLLPLVKDSRVPVLLIHGDSHRYVFDQPFTLNRQVLAQLYRLEVPGGAGDLRAVKVTVNLDNPSQPFAVERLSP